MMLMREMVKGMFLLVIVGGLLGGCAAWGGDQGSKPGALGKAGADPEQVQSEVMSFADTFISAISQQWNQADASASANPGAPPRSAIPSAPSTPATPPASSAPPTPGAAVVKAASDKGRRASLEIKISNVAGALAIATSPNAVVGLADMITMITLERMILEDPWATETFGPEKAARLVGVYKEHEAKAWRIAEHVFTTKQQEELRALIAQWRKEHPDQRYIAGVRLEDFARDRGTVNLSPEQSGPGSLLALVGLDPLANLDPTIREVQRSRLLGERIFFYSEHAPTILKWQTESLYTGFLQTPEVKQAMASMAEVSDAAYNVADAADQMRKDLSKERHDAIVDLFGQLTKERQETMDQLFKGISDERRQTLKDIDEAQDKLGGTLKQAKETVAATQSLTDSLRSTIQAADALAARFAPAPGSGGSGSGVAAANDSGPKKDVLAEYREAANQTAQTVDKLSVLADRVEKILASPELDARAGNLRVIVDSVQGGVQHTIDRAFMWMVGLAVASAFCLGAAIAFGLSGHKALERRSAVKRRNARGTK